MVAFVTNWPATAAGIRGVLVTFDNQVVQFQSADIVDFTGEPGCIVARSSESLP